MNISLFLLLKNMPKKKKKEKRELKLHTLTENKLKVTPSNE